MMNQNTVTREECFEWTQFTNGPLLSREDAKRLARAHLELLDKLKEAEDMGLEVAFGLDRANKERDELRSQKAALESQLAEARKDTKRLDLLLVYKDEIVFWIDPDGLHTIILNGTHRFSGRSSWREAIDIMGALRAKPEAWKPSDPVWPPK